MSTDLVPFTLKQTNAPEFSRMAEVLVPAEPLTGRRAAVYDKMSHDWDRLTVTERTAVYAFLLQVTLTRDLSEIMLAALTEHFERLAGITDARVRTAFTTFSNTLVQQDAEFGWRLKAVTQDKMASVLREPTPPPVPPKNFWRWLLSENG